VTDETAKEIWRLASVKRAEESRPCICEEGSLVTDETAKEIWRLASVKRAEESRPCICGTRLLSGAP